MNNFKLLMFICFSFPFSFCFGNERFEDWRVVKGERYELCQDANELFNSIGDELVLSNYFPKMSGGNFAEMKRTYVDKPSNYFPLFEDYYRNRFPTLSDEVLERRVDFFLDDIRVRINRGDQFVWESAIDLDADGKAEQVLLIETEWAGGLFPEDPDGAKFSPGLLFIPFEGGHSIRKYLVSRGGIPFLYDGKIRFFNWLYSERFGRYEYRILDFIHHPGSKRSALVEVCKLFRNVD